MSESNPLVLPGRALSLAWLAVALAASDDKARPALYRTVQVRVYDHGVTLAATDSYMVVRAFVPFDGDFESWYIPSLDEVTREQFVVCDVEWRARDLFRYVERVTKGCDDPKKDTVDIDVALTRNAKIDTNTPTLDPSLDAPLVFVEIPGEERIVCREFEAGFPELGRLMAFQPKTATKLLFSPRLISRAAQAAQRVGASGIRLTPTSGGAVAFDLDWYGFPPTADLSGLLMPMRDETEEVPS